MAEGPSRPCYEVHGWMLDSRVNNIFLPSPFPSHLPGGRHHLRDERAGVHCGRVQRPGSRAQRKLPGSCGEGEPLLSAMSSPLCDPAVMMMSDIVCAGVPSPRPSECSALLTQQLPLLAGFLNTCGSPHASVSEPIVIDLRHRVTPRVSFTSNWYEPWCRIHGSTTVLMVLPPY